MIDGPAGKLEAVLLTKDDAVANIGLAVIAHPHPLHGGSMDNKIVQTLFKTFAELGYVAVKFNFRGVGNSAGHYGEGAGETQDVLAVVAALRAQPTYRELPLLLAGFSFGGAVQAHAAQSLRPQKLVLVAPSVDSSVDRLDAPAVASVAGSTLIIHGEADEVVPLKSVLDWARAQDLPVTVIPGGEHFFHGRLTLLKKIVADFS